MSVEFVCYVETIIVFYKFWDFFYKRHYLMNRLFQAKQHENLGSFLFIENI